MAISTEGIIEQTQAILKKPITAYATSIVILLLIGVSLMPIWRSNPLHDNIKVDTNFNVGYQNTTDLDSLNLFGVYTTSNAIPQSNLDLKLVGTIASQNANNAYALISDPSGKTKPYQIGDTLPGGAILNKIEQDKVIINNAGRNEEIILPKPKLN